MKFKILLLTLFISQISYAQSIVTLITKSDNFFETLSQGKFDVAQEFFDESIKEQLTPEVLKKFWANIGEKLGTYESVENAQNSVKDQHFVVILDCKFSNGKQSFMFTYTKSEKIIGFVIVPKDPELIYVDPAYADSTQYKEQYITVKSGTHELAGMLTTPKNAVNFPIVVLVHGSGPGDMDESVGPNKPFRDLALGLASKGIATLRYVKRTRVYPQEFRKVFTVKEEVTDDALAVLEIARTTPGVDKKQIYLLGHSLGGMLAPKLATLAPDLNGIILAAAPARKLTDLILEQGKYMYKLSKDTTAATKKQYDMSVIEVEKTRLLKLGALAPDSTLLGIPASYWIDLNMYDQLATAKKIKNRILVLQGANDFQVSVQDFNMWKSALIANKNAAFKLYPDLNHLLIGQTEKGTTAQYQKTGNVAAYLISDIAAWIKTK